MKHADIIALFGGIRPMATALGHDSASTVQGWKNRGLIPRWRWHEILGAAKRLKIALKQDDFLPKAKKKK